MTEPFRSAVAFRNDLCDTVGQLQQRLTRPLPNGATVYVTGADALYRLVKDLGSAFDGLGSAIEVPSDGSANRWVQESVHGASPWSGIEVATANAAVTQNAPNAWIGLGTTAGSFQLSTGDSGMLAVNPTTSVLTYHGITRQMTLRYQVTIANNTGVDLVAQAAISVDNDVPPDTTADHRGAGQQASTILDANRHVITGERSVLLAPGSIVRLMLRAVLATPTLTVEFFSLSLAPN